MKIACVLTTINVPRVLALYAKYGPDVRFFVIGDRKSPDTEIMSFLSQHDINSDYYPIDGQYKLGWKCARLIPENCIQRRNIGFLEALKWGADVVVSIDDDNIPMDNEYFFEMARRTWYPEQWEWHGFEASSPSGWFDVGTLLQPAAEHRGFPHTKRAQPAFKAVTDAKIGVAAGICLGDPDISAVERIANAPIVHGVSEILRSGVIVDPAKTWTVFNSQNTAVVRELVPAWFMLPFWGRYDDIYASLIVQRVACELGYHVHFGKPFVWQERNKHDLIKDLRQEIDGMEKIEKLANFLDSFLWVESWSILEGTSILFDMLATLLPKESIQAALAWIEDCAEAMK